MLLSGNEAVALAAHRAGVALGTGYPGTPSTEILERFSALGGRAQWAPNEKVALEVALGVAFGRGAALVAMKHVGLNVAADPLFSAAYTGISGSLVIVSADDPGMASSQNEQDNRRFAVAAGVPMLEPADSQEAYDFTLAAFELSRRRRLPVMLRTTTRVCHGKSIVRPVPPTEAAEPAGFHRDIASRVMIPVYARKAHRRLRRKLAEIAKYSEESELNTLVEGNRSLGIITSGISAMHVREAAPQASVLKLGLTYPLPLKLAGRFAESVGRCVVIEEGDPYLVEQLRTAGIPVEGKPEMYRLGELDVGRVRRILAGDTRAEPEPPRGKLPELCKGCPHRAVFASLKKLDCIVAGDIGCYSLAALPPLEAMDLMVCMGAGIGMGLGLRHVLPAEQARRVVSVIGDSTFVHGGITGLVEMVYNPPPTGHVVLILDNQTTAMTGLQEHPGTGLTLDRRPTGKVVFEDLARSLGVSNVWVVDPLRDSDNFERVLRESLEREELTVIITRHPCLLATAKKSEKRISRIEPLAASQRPKVQASAKHNMQNHVTNVVITGLGGQGVIRASDILACAAFSAGLDVKKTEVHGMSQRGGAVIGDVRFGRQVHSPMVPPGEADFLLVLADDQVENSHNLLGKGGLRIGPNAVDRTALANRRSLNVALLGVLSRHLDIDDDAWHKAIRDNFKPELHQANQQAFELGRAAGG